MTELLVTHDGNSVSFIEYGTTSTAIDLASFDVNLVSNTVNILATGITTAELDYRVSQTLFESPTVTVLLPTISINSITEDNTIDGIEAGSNVTVTGSTENTLTGDTVTLTVGSTTYTTSTDENGDYSIAIPGASLASETSVSASVSTLNGGVTQSVSETRTYAVTLSQYATIPYEPDVVVDFKNNYYRSKGVVKTFSDMLTYTGDGNKTMVDSDGLIKWAPHNLITNSQNFSNFVDEVNSEIIPNNVVGPDGVTNSGSSFQVDNVGGTGGCRWYQQVNFISRGIFTYAIWIKKGTERYVNLTSSALNSPTSDNLSATVFDLENGSLIIDGEGNGLASISDAGNGWFLCSATFEITGTDYTGDIRLHVSNADGTNKIINLDGSIVYYCYGAHLYRSDLGGMVDNYEQDDTLLKTYVPTTTTPVYKARVGHHVYDANTSTWVNKGVLLETEARTNLYEDSELNSYTVLKGITVTSGHLGVTGLNDVNLFTEDNLDDSHAIDPLKAVTTEERHTISLFAKSNGRRWLAIVIASSAGDRNEWAYFDLESGSTGSLNGTRCVSSGIESYGNGWYRVHLVVDLRAQSGYPFAIYFSDTDQNVRLPSYQGDGTSGIYIWGAQLEEGSTPSSYIPTSGASATRVAESLSIPSTNMAYSNTAMSFAVDAVLNEADVYTTATNKHILFWFDPTDGNSGINIVATFPNDNIRYQSGKNVNLMLAHSTNGTVQPTYDTHVNTAIRFNNDNISLRYDGVTYTNTHTLTSPQADPTGYPAYLMYNTMGYLSSFRQWATDITDAGIADATTQTFDTNYSDYAVLSAYEPKTVADFTNNYYRVRGADTTFDRMFEHTRNTNATMVDSDGLIKWAPHNLQDASENLDSWRISNVVVNNTEVFAEFDFSFEILDGTYDIKPFGNITSLVFGVFAKPNGTNSIMRFGRSYSAAESALFDLTNGSVLEVAAGYTASIQPIVGGWFFCKVTALVAGSGYVAFAKPNDSYFVQGVHGRAVGQ